MKEYKIMFKSIKLGDWIRPFNLCRKGIFKDESEAIEYAKDYLRRDQEREYPAYSDYKILCREVSEWKEART